MNSTNYIFSKLTEDDVLMNNFISFTSVHTGTLEPAEFNVRDMFNRTAAILEVFDWCDELGVVMTFGFSKQFNEYFINLNKDKWFKSVYISREILDQGLTHVYDLILNAVKELNIVNEDEKGE